MQEMTIEQLKEELKNVEADLRIFQTRQSEIRNAIAEKNSLFAVGDTIEYPYGRGGTRKGVVSRIYPDWDDKVPNMDVRTILASGKPGAIHTVHWFDHKKCVLRVKGVA